MSHDATAVPSELQLAEASESSASAEADKNVPDPSPEDGKKVLGRLVEGHAVLRPAKRGPAAP